MTQYILQRIVLAVPTVLGMTVLIFFMFRVLMPVDAVELQSAVAEVVDPELEQELREKYGLHGSLPEQYLRWLGNLLQGDSGRSFYTDRPVVDEMMRRVPTSLQLGLGAVLISAVIAVPLGLLSAVRQDSFIDYATRGTAILFYALPGFWIATLVLVLASTWFQWAPPIEYKSFWVDPRSNLLHMLIPTLILGLRPIGVLSRLVRTQVLEVVRQDYMRTAWAKGLSPRDVYFRHALRNALIPFVTVIGLEIPSVVAGTVIYEQIFVIPGVGQYLVQALQRLDLYVILSTNLFFALILVFAILIVDISYAFIDSEDPHREVVMNLEVGSGAHSAVHSRTDGLVGIVRWPAWFARKKPLGFFGLVILLVFGLAALLAPVVTTHGYDETDFGARFAGPSSEHWFGTDNLGRDLYTRVVYGARVSFGISFAAVIIAKGLATLIGVISGYYGGWLDKIFQRFVDIWIALPTLVILITLVAILGPSVQTLIIVIGLTYAPNSSRLIRSVVLQVREEPYVLAALSMGASNRRIMFQHVLPNIMHMVIFSATVTLGAIILIAASLGFLGYGVPPPHPDLGAMLSGDGLTHMRRAPLMAVWPGIAITLVVLAFNVFGDAIRDVLDPRLRGTR